MRIAVCESSREGERRLTEWINRYGMLYGLTASVECFRTPSELESSDALFEIAFVAFGGSAGFMAARRLRERSPSMRIILIDDTREYAVGSVRIHCTDFLMRPLTFGQVARSMSLALRGAQ